MSKLLARAALAALIGGTAVVTPASADQFVNGYFRGNGTYVAPYIRSSPDGYTWNNYGRR